MQRIRAWAVGFSLALPFLSATASADAPTTVFTTLIVQVEGQPPNNEVVVSADNKKQPTSEMKLSVYLGAIPPGASLESCRLRLVTSSGLPAANDNGLSLQLFDAIPKQVAARSIDPGTASKTAIILETKGLCSSLEETLKKRTAAPAAPAAQFRMRTTIANGNIKFYGRPPGASSEAPRLSLTYKLPDSWPGRADWAQGRRDAQHSGRSAWRLYNIYNQNESYTPTSFAVRFLGNATFAEVSPPFLLYRREVLAVSPDGAAVQMMDGGGTVLKTIPLEVKARFIAASQQGWLYVTGASDKIVLQRIEGGEGRIAIEKKAEETVLLPPTIGADGSLYVVTSQYVNAYPAPPVPVDQANLPLWRYRTTAAVNNDVSAVALSEDGKTAYIVHKPAATMIALDAATGAEKWKQAGLPISRGANEPMPIPVVADGAVFVTDHAPTGSKLYIVDDRANPPVLETLPGKDITAPVVGPDQSVYYVRDGILQRSRRDPAEQKFTEQAVGGLGCDKMGGFDLLRADQSGNLYALDRVNMRFMFVASDNKSVPAGTCEAKTISGLDFGAGLAVAADGTAYDYTLSKQLQAIIPAALFGPLRLSNEILKLSPDGKALVENNDMTFRAGKTVETAPDLSLPANTNINIVAGDSIRFGPGLRIAQGARLRARVGF
jgi:hypothetical protein